MLREDLAGAVARGWCAPNNWHKIMDVDLAYAIVDEVEAQIKRDERPLLGLAMTGELINELRARAEIGGYANDRVYGDEKEPKQDEAPEEWEPEPSCYDGCPDCENR